MKGRWKRAAIGAAAMLVVAVTSGCGTVEKVAYVDVNMIATDSAKGKEITKKLEDRQATIAARLQEASQSQGEEEFARTQMQARQEFMVYQQAMAREMQSYISGRVSDIARDKGYTIVLTEGVVTGGGDDITAQVLEKMNAGTEASSSQASGK